MLQRLRDRAGGQEGFTLIELLVVILIIGILAAVAVPAFLSQRSKGQDASVKSDINTAQQAEESWYTDHSAYTAASTDLTGVEGALAGPMTASGKEKLTASTTATGAFGAKDPTGASSGVQYEIQATSDSGVVYALDKYADGGISRTCMVPANTNPGGCKGVTQSGADANGTW